MRMTLIQTPQQIFADARAMQASALEQLSAGDIRDAAEKAWCATKRATEALLLKVNGEVPPTTVGVSSGLTGSEDGIARTRKIASGTVRMKQRSSCIHDCFYDGHCEPVVDTERLIRETAQLHRGCGGAGRNVDALTGQGQPRKRLARSGESFHFQGKGIGPTRPPSAPTWAPGLWGRPPAAPGRRCRR